MFRTIYYNIKNYFFKRKNDFVNNLRLIKLNTRTDPYSYNSHYYINTTYDKIKIEIFGGSDSKLLIESTYNNLIYPVFDLDNENKLKKFKEIITEKYVIFRSSKRYDDETDKVINHYWAILDLPLTNIKDFIHSDITWNVINDSKYISFTKNSNAFFIRALYKTKERKPVITYESKDLSENFSSYIKKMENFINTKSLELSATKYKNLILLKMYNRKVILKNLLD